MRTAGASGSTGTPAESPSPVLYADESLIRLYERVSPAVVGIQCWSKDTPARDVPSAFGTGMLIHPDGLILTSITVVPDDTRRIQVHLRGGRLMAAETVKSVPEKEMVLIRILRKDGAPGGGKGPPPSFPFLRLGDSSSLAIGRLAFALGNAFQSIPEDDQVSFTAGAVSGSYVLTETRGESRYTGPVIEISTAVNDGMDGGPLVDFRGDLVGLLSLNYSRNRWLGTAIPIDVLKPYLAEVPGWIGDPQDRSSAYLGLEIVPAALAAGPGADSPRDGEGRRPSILRIDAGGPAARAGLLPGDLVESWNGIPTPSLAEIRPRFAAARPGQRVKLEILRKGSRTALEAVFWGRF